MMFKKSALIATAALAFALSAGAAVAATDDVADEATTPVVTCDGTQQRLGDGTGTCPYGNEAIQTRARGQQRTQAQDPAAASVQNRAEVQTRAMAQDPALCTGDGPHGPQAGQAGSGAGYRHGVGDGTGPIADPPMDGTGNRYGANR